MATINLYDAKTHLSELVERAASGEEIVIGKSGKPMARLVPYEPAPGPARKPGAWRGQVKVHNDFDELPPDIDAAFAGERD